MRTDATVTDVGSGNTPLVLPLFDDISEYPTKHQLDATGAAKNVSPALWNDGTNGLHPNWTATASRSWRLLMHSLRVSLNAIV
ncbi:hypothetical protein CKO51_32990 [Rhodopirellula sp. SM50]|nr:hypothetical protein CKO51_32990 [Rhodopirellula sp. SM50]